CAGGRGGGQRGGRRDLRRANHDPLALPDRLAGRRVRAMVTRMIDAATGKVFRDSIAQLQRDVHRELHRDAFTLWKRDRPPGSWDAGESREGWELLTRGTGSIAE